MSGSSCGSFAGIVLIIAGIFLAGCTSVSVGDVAYRGGNFSVNVTSPVATDNSYIQVTAFTLKDLRQEEVATFGIPIGLAAGENRIVIPGVIDHGEYKLYIYVLQNGTRKAAVIRDILV